MCVSEREKLTYACPIPTKTLNTHTHWHALSCQCHLTKLALARSLSDAFTFWLSCLLVALYTCCFLHTMTAFNGCFNCVHSFKTFKWPLPTLRRNIRHHRWVTICICMYVYMDAHVYVRMWLAASLLPLHLLRLSVRANKHGNYSKWLQLRTHIHT